MFEVKNIKISLKISKIPLNSVINQFEVENIQYKIKNIYIILRNIFVYILFKPKNSEISHVNITGIPNVESISKSIEINVNILDGNVNILDRFSAILYNSSDLG